MVNDRHHCIFISYAHRDGAELAARLQRDLTANGFDTWLDTQRIVGGAVWTVTIEQEMDNRDIILALLTPGSYRSEICRAEQLRALRKGKRLIPILAAKDADLPLHIEPFQYRSFTDNGSYPRSFRELLGDIRGDVTATLAETFRQTDVRYITAPPLVANYIERPEAVRALREYMFAEDQRVPIALTALTGMGGIGKTVLAQALIRDQVVQHAFPDGIVWITVGRKKHQNFVQQMQEIAKALGDDLNRYDNPVACQNQYKTTLANKAALLIVDDVWSKGDIAPLLAESSRSRFLFTTRDASIANFLGAGEHRLDLMDMAQSRELMAAWAGLPVKRMADEADDIIRECGRLPLALSQIGALLRGANHIVWKDTLDLLRKVDLSAIQEQLPPGQENLFRSVDVSFLALQPKMQEKYKALAVLLDDMSAPLPILQTLWNASEAEARRARNLFFERSLAQREPDGETLRLHDLQLDYVRSQYLDKEALSLIHGAVGMSSYIVSKDPGQFGSQITGRLMSHEQHSGVQYFLKSIAAGAPRPWLRSQWPTLDQAGSNLVRTLQSYSTAISIAPDGRYAVSACGNRGLKVWDLEKGQELRTLQGHVELFSGGGGIRHVVTDVVVTADGRCAISTSSDKTLKVWDLDSGRELRTLIGHSDAVNGVTVTADARRAISASSDKTLKVWDLESGQELRTLKGHSDSVNSVTVTADARRAISASSDKTLKVWDLESGRQLHTLRGHSGWVSAVAVTANGQRVVSASADMTLRVWDLESGQELHTLKGHSGGVLGVAVTADGRCVVSASMDNTLKAWDLESGRELRTFQGHSGWVKCVAVTADGSRAISASSDGALKVWDLLGGPQLRRSRSHLGAVTHVAVTTDGVRAVSASGNELKVWNLKSGRELHAHLYDSSEIIALPVTLNGMRVVSRSVDHTLKIWDLETGRQLYCLQGHQYVIAVAITVDERHAVSAGADKRLKIWNLATGRELRTLDSGFVNGLVLAADGKQAISCAGDEILKVWDLENGCELRTWRGHTAGIFSLALAAHSRHVVSASLDKTVKVWDVGNGCALRTLSGHSESVGHVAVSPDGNRAVSASWDWQLKVWDLETGDILATFTLESTAGCCAFVNSKMLIAGDTGGRLYLLSLEE